MKLARCEQGGAVFWGVVDTPANLVSRIESPFDAWAPRITAGEGLSALKLNAKPTPLSALRLLPPIEKSKRVVVAGANYA
ncbi:MAG TPA: Rv2993c-like domain-containing protein, partial [Steroidobacteraceae bacterium]|nr:Rv2993c-like domain-containing protein [Steroidobacteraceae bacterium]